MTGVVSAIFVVGTSDQAENIQLSGHPILAAEVGNAVRRAGFPAACQSHTVTLNFKFVLEGELADQPTTSVVFKSPNEYIVTSNATGIVCALNATQRKRFNFVGLQSLKSWWRSSHDAGDRASGDQRKK